jgi:hypothetical protein
MERHGGRPSHITAGSEIRPYQSDPLDRLLDRLTSQLSANQALPPQVPGESRPRLRPARSTRFGSIFQSRHILF